MEDPTLVYKILSAVAFTLLALTTIGVAYLTISGWRDRRRQENERRELAIPGKQGKRGKR